jgi:hypothetical protein
MVETQAYKEKDEVSIFQQRSYIRYLIKELFSKF